MYCLYIILHADIIGLIIFLKLRLEPRLWAFSCCYLSPSPIQAHQWAGLKQARLGCALGPAQHITMSYTDISGGYIVLQCTEPKLLSPIFRGDVYQTTATIETIEHCRTYLFFADLSH
jgi:hypothetical protein